MSEERKHIPVSPNGKDKRSLSAVTRHQAIKNIKEQHSNKTWAELKEEGWIVLDTSGPPQQEMY